MREKIRIILVGIAFLFYLAAAITIEMFNWLPLTLFLIGIVLWLTAYYLPEEKPVKPKRYRPIYSDWDACYDIAIRASIN